MTNILEAVGHRGSRKGRQQRADDFHGKIKRKLFFLFIQRLSEGSEVPSP